MKTASTVPYNRVHVVGKCWFDFRFVFGSFLMLVRLQKTNQNIRNCGIVLVWFWYGFGMVLVWFWYGFGMVLVWFWYGFGMVLVWFWYGFGLVLVLFKPGPKPYQNHTKTKRIYVITYVGT